MRILIVNYEYPPVGGGAATAAEAIAKELVQLGHHACVLTGGFKGLPSHGAENGITVRRLPSFRRAIDRSGIWEMLSFLIVALVMGPRIIRKARIERCLVFFSLPCGPIALLARWVLGVPYVVTLRGGDVPGTEPSLNLIHRLLAPLRRAVLRNSISIVANSEGLQKMSETADPYPVRVIPNGVDTDLFKPPTRKEPAGALRVLFVGRFQPQKNLPYLFKQIAQLAKGTFELHLAGDGPQRERLERAARELGIADAVIWHGWLPRELMPRLYHSVDCLVNPSLYEGMPNVVLEAMACALPVIASNVPGNAALVLDGENGLLFDLRDNPAGFITALNRLRDVDLRRRMGESARERACKFSWENVAAQYVDLLSSVSTKMNDEKGTI
ncbi:MAG: glycosyltransferase family 4 protein [Verrucomicrobiota bacterium]